jgi:L-lactate dehydrogenase complex protein LldG
VEQIENPGRERILQRIRLALSAGAAHPAPGSDAQIFAPIPNLLERFQSECATNHTECILTADANSTATVVGEIVSAIPGEVFVQDAPELRQAAALWPAGSKVRWSSQGRLAEETQVTVTLAEALVAQTGSIFVSSACGGRSATVAAPVHVVVAHLTQLLSDLQTLFARVSGDAGLLKNSMQCLTTGSSRTADIEKILVLGAHGPKRLVVVLQRNA